MKRDLGGRVWAGLCLIALGVAFLAANLKGWDQVWPIFPLLVGIAFIGGYVFGGMKDGGLAFLGTGLVLTGLFFFGFTMGRWEWGQMGKLWPVFPLIWGLAFLVSFVAERRRRDTGALVVGLAALIVGGVGLAYTHGYVTGDIISFWPLLLVLAGVVGLIGALTRGARRG